MVGRWWLSEAELNYWLSTAESVNYTTVRGAYRMAPLTTDELSQSPNTMLFLSKSEPYACYIIKYGVGAFKTTHRDPPLRGSSKLVHLRMVCLLQNAEQGGQLTIDGHEELFLPRDAIIFRADTSDHGVSEVLLGERIILTVGKLVESE